MVICLDESACDLHTVRMMPLLHHHVLLLEAQNGRYFWCQLAEVVLDKKSLDMFFVCLHNVLLVFYFINAH